MKHGETKTEKAQGPSNAQAERPKDKLTTGIPTLDDLLDRAQCSEIAGIVAVLKMSEVDSGIASKIKAYIGPEITKIRKRDLGEEKSKYDFESDIAPVDRWMDFAEGFEAFRGTGHIGGDLAIEEIINNQGPEFEGDPHLRMIKRWMSRRTHSEKLTALLLWELINKESVFEGEDHDIGQYFDRAFKQSMIESLDDEGYLQKADPIEVAVTGFTVGWLPMAV